MSLGWECEVCLITNDPFMADGTTHRTQCESCETLRSEGVANSTTAIPREIKPKDSLLPPDELRKAVPPSESSVAWNKGSMSLWGSGECDQIPTRPVPARSKSVSGSDDDTGVLLCATKLSGNYSFVAVAAGALHTVALTVEGEVVTFGCNDNDTLGRPAELGCESSPGVVALDQPCLEVAAGICHSAVRTESGGVLVWGTFTSPSGKRRPYGDSAAVGVIDLPFPAIRLVSGGDFGAALCAESLEDTKPKLFGWGYNSCGQFGQGAVKNDEDFISAYEMKTPPGISRVLDLFAGSDGIILKVEEGETYKYFVAGKNGAGECGIGSTEMIIDSWKEISALRGIDMEQFSFGSNHVLSRTRNGKVFAWGLAEAAVPGMAHGAVRFPQLLDSLEQPVESIAAGGRTSIVVVQGIEGPSVLGWGDSQVGQLLEEADEPLGKPKTLLESTYDIQAVAVAAQHVVALSGAKSRSTAHRRPLIISQPKGTKRTFKKPEKKEKERPRRETKPRRSDNETKPRRSVRLAKNRSVG